MFDVLVWSDEDSIEANVAVRVESLTENGPRFIRFSIDCNASTIRSPLSSTVIVRQLPPCKATYRVFGVPLHSSTTVQYVICVAVGMLL